MEKIQNEAVIFRGGINGVIVGSFRPADSPALTEKRGDSSFSNLSALGLSSMALERDKGGDLRQNFELFVQGMRICAMEMFLAVTAELKRACRRSSCYMSCCCLHVFGRHIQRGL